LPKIIMERVGISGRSEGACRSTHRAGAAAGVTWTGLSWDSQHIILGHTQPTLPKDVGCDPREIESIVSP